MNTILRHTGHSDHYDTLDLNTKDSNSRRLGILKFRSSSDKFEYQHLITAFPIKSSRIPDPSDMAAVTDFWISKSSFRGDLPGKRNVTGRTSIHSLTNRKAARCAHWISLTTWVISPLFLFAFRNILSVIFKFFEILGLFKSLNFPTNRPNLRPGTKCVRNFRRIQCIDFGPRGC